MMHGAYSVKLLTTYGTTQCRIRDDHNSLPSKDIPRQNETRNACIAAVFKPVNSDRRNSENLSGRIKLLKSKNLKHFRVFLHLAAILTTLLLVNIITRYILKTVDLRQNWNRKSESLTLLLIFVLSSFTYWRHSVAPLVETLRCKPEGRGFIYLILPAALGSWGRPSL